MAFQARQRPLLHRARQVLIYASWVSSFDPRPLWWDFGTSRLLAVAAARLQSRRVCKTGARWKPIVSSGNGSCPSSQAAVGDLRVRLHRTVYDLPAERPKMFYYEFAALSV